MKALELSQYIIAKFDESGDFISNKKLQKILYYIEAWSLVHLNSIIDEDFEAWVHGPVIPEVYHEYKKYGYNPINTDKNYNATDFITDFKIVNINYSEHFHLIDGVLDEYGVLSSLELELLSHSEEPWNSVRKNLLPSEHSTSSIDKALMKKYYSSLIS